MPEFDGDSSRLGVRRLRADLAAHVRRAEAGQRLVVTVGERPVAMLGPLAGGDVTLDDLIAGGALLAPRRSDAACHSHPVPVWTGARLDQAFRDVRG
jgi:antitoxin (DNA-binding transcriptional repressor) of toxin-antitoxin stability system